MMIRSLELVLSVKGKITRLSVSPSGPVGLCFTGPTKRGKDQKGKAESLHGWRDRAGRVRKETGHGKRTRDRVSLTTVSRGLKG